MYRFEDHVEWHGNIKAEWSVVNHIDKKEQDNEGEPFWHRHIKFFMTKFEFVDETVQRYKNEGTDGDKISYSRIFLYQSLETNHSWAAAYQGC